MITTHRTGTQDRTPRQQLQRDLCLAQSRIRQLEQQLDEVFAQNADLITENEQLRDSLAQHKSIAATCEALGL